MKTKQFLSATLAIVALMASCKKDDYRKLPSTEGVQFTSKIEGSAVTKASGTTWGANDEIGVFMKQGTGLGNALAANKKYVTPGNGNFTATGTDVINYPDQGKVDFIAYYPYASAVSGTTLPINVSNQTAQEKIDVMYSNNATGLDKTSGNPALTFQHKLSKIEINVTGGTGVNISGLKAVLNAVNTTASMDLTTGVISAGSNSANVNAKIISVDGKNTVEAILIPGDYAGKEVVFTSGNENFKWTLPANLAYETGKKYSYNVSLESGETKQVVVEGNATITDWTSIIGGSFKAGKDGGTVTTTPEPTTNAKEQTFYQEGFGEKGKDRLKVEKYMDFENKGVTYSSIFPGFADIRATSTMNSHLWLPANRNSGLKIEGIKSEGFKDVVLTFDIAAQELGPVNGVTVKINGKELSTSGDLKAKNKFIPVKVSGIESASTMTLEFVGTAANNKVGYRVDNVKLVGKK
ncbi:fimbrillin family protein [Sphingobacterium daejeonense]|uniref:Fimbrillin family protein n=1 Tax=Sphingobacterium daejeonense TaxID=371142 RepID=A0ABW3RH02_9SPHI